MTEYEENNYTVVKPSLRDRFNAFLSDKTLISDADWQTQNAEYVLVPKELRQG